MIKVENLVKKYDQLTAVDDISFEVNQGDILAFLGPNGAGKSTTMKMLSCFIAASGGTASICGYNIHSARKKVKESIGYLPESAPSFKDMSVAEFLKFIAEIRGFSGKKRKERVDYITDLTSLDSVYYQTIETLSKGYRQRVGFAQALLHDPPVLILDEPTDGLDPNQKNDIRKLITNIGKEKAIILSTHILEEMQAICNRAIIINKGKIITDTIPTALQKQSIRHNLIKLTIKNNLDAAIKKISALPFVHKITKQTDTIIEIMPKNADAILDKLMLFIIEQQIGFEHVALEQGSYDEVFHNLTRSSIR